MKPINGYADSGRQMKELNPCSHLTVNSACLLPGDQDAVRGRIDKETSQVSTASLIEPTSQRCYCTVHDTVALKSQHARRHRGTRTKP